MLVKTKPSTARCTDEMYISYLLSDSQHTSCTRLADILETVSHDGINIERFHRAIKQVCNIEHFQVGNENPIKNHIFCSIKAFVKLEFMRFNRTISHWYEIKKD